MSLSTFGVYQPFRLESGRLQMYIQLNAYANVTDEIDASASCARNT
ncbi:hypothetical protein SAMN04515647_2158 [Cohaesibacter sp. ES.047]|nr:hypothetical protein SAMN04515647_2158 [Cohaesibacter sp. ES.047]